MFNNIDSAFDYIYSFTNLESNFQKKNVNKEYSLENIKNILKIFGNPEQNQKIIHITGTKGKGSTALFSSTLLNNLGYNVATFMSPHLIKPNERILFNLKEILDEDIINILNKIEPILIKNNLHPTTFELFFLIFLIYAKERNADYFVIEVGLGGRLDCTNVIDPLISIITSISFDHTNILGKSIKKIAIEKAGIIKPHKNVIVSKQSFRCINVLKKIANKNHSPFFDIKKHFKIIRSEISNEGIKFTFKINGYLISDFLLPVFGKHQIYNFASALLSVFLINSKIVDILNDSKKLYIKIPARVELLGLTPPIILDVSHNQDSAKKLKETLKNHFPKTKWTVLSGMAIDKDYSGFYKELKSITKESIITPLSEYKKSNSSEVYQISKSIIKNTIFIESFHEAINYALTKKGPLLITGSFYIAGPFLEYWQNIPENK